MWPEFSSPVRMSAIANSLGHFFGLNDPGEVRARRPGQHPSAPPTSATFSLPASPHSTGRRIGTRRLDPRHRYQARAQRDELRDRSDLGVSPENRGQWQRRVRCSSTPCISEINELATRSAHSPNGLPGPCWPFEGRRPATAEREAPRAARSAWRSRISGASRKSWCTCCPPR